MNKWFALLCIFMSMTCYAESANFFDCTKADCGCGDDPTFSMKLNSGFVQEAFLEESSKLVGKDVKKEEFGLYHNDDLAYFVFTENKDRFEVKSAFEEGLCFLRTKEKKRNTGINKLILEKLADQKDSCESFYCKITNLFK